MQKNLDIVDVKVRYKLLDDKHLQNRDRFYLEICISTQIYNYWTSDIKKIARGLGVRKQTIINRLKKYNVDDKYEFYDKDEIKRFIERYITPIVIFNKFSK